MKVLFSLLLMLCFWQAESQYYYRGQNSSAIKWRQINTEHYQLIYSAEFEAKAQYTSNLLALVYEKANKTLVVKPRKISIILQNDLVEANGFVTLAPWRSEYFSTPPQDDEGLEWLNLLAVHEYRHVVQISKYKQGMTKFFYWLLGEQGIGAVFGATTPLWFVEGDAVGFETFATGYGRGRLPSFSMESRAMLLQLGAFNYDKASFGSFKTFVPDRYHLGYHFTSYVKEKYGSMVWDTVLNRVASFPLRPYPFSQSLRHVAGKGTSAMYKEMTAYLNKKWSLQMQSNAPYYTTFSSVSDTNQKTFTSYVFPLQSDNGIIAVKKGMADAPQLVLLSNGKEKTLSMLGSHDGASLHCNKKFAVWVEEFPDLRWEYRTFSDIVLFDLKNSKRIRLTENQRLFAPNLSEDNKIVAVSVSKENVPSLVFIDALGGKTYLSKSFGAYDMIYFPVWGSNGDVFFVAKKEGYQHLMKWNAFSDVLEPVLENLPYVLTHLNYQSRALYFHSTQMGIDNIFRVDVLSKKTFQITVSKFGAFNPCVTANGKILYNDYSAKGMRIVESVLSDEEIAAPMFVSQGLLLYSNALQNEQKVVVDKNNFKVFETKKYIPALHLINIHSWGPVSVNAENREAASGFSVQSQNKLSTSVASYNYTYNAQQDQTTRGIKYQYMGFYPKYSVEAVRDDRDVLLSDSSLSRLLTDRLNAQIDLDINVTKGYYQTTLGATGRYSYINFARQDGVGGRVDVFDFIAYLSRMARRAKRDIYPKWGLYASVFARVPVVESPFSSTSTYALATVYVPGLLKHHGVQIKLETQVSTAIGLTPANNVDLPRGYVNSGQKYTYGSIASAKVDYNFPLCYPDLKMGAIAYLQRIRMGFHYDVAAITNTFGAPARLQSFGTELRGDINLFRYSYLMDVGVRVSFTESNSFSFNQPYFQLLYSVSFY